MTDENSDGLSGLVHALAIRRSGYIRHENAETGAIVFFPEMAKSEHEWEARALEMHNAQIPVVLERKAEENVLANRVRVIRGD